MVIWSHPPIISGPEPRWRAPTIEGEPHHERPLITLMLRHRKELELSPEQVQGLEQLREDYQREATRYEANLRIAEMELQRLLKADTVDLDKIKVKLQELERLRVDLSFVRIRTIEQGKALLSPEQREKLQTLVGEFEQPRLITEASPE